MENIKKLENNAKILYKFCLKIIRDPENTIKFLKQTCYSSDENFTQDLLSYELRAKENINELDLD